MEFHPDKCQVICITNHLKSIIHTYNVHGINLQKSDSVKYLGVTIDSNLNWKEHCTSVYNKATFMMSFQRDFFYKCPPHVKEQCFNALVRPLLEYGCTAWDSYRSYQIDKLENINKRAARFITGNFKREHGNNAKT